MSVSGPCAWLSSVPPPSAPHPPAVSNSWSSISWNSEQGSQKPRINLSRLPGPWEKESDPAKTSPIDMQPAVLKAENAFSAGASAASSNSAQYSGEEMSLNDSENRNTDAQSDTLSRMRLERLNHSEPLLVESQKIISPGLKREISPDAKKGDLNDIHEDERDGGDVMVASSDDGAGSSLGDDKKSSPDSKSEKKKMKRFRLTHNQTRFLMSEFTRQAHPDAAHRERLSREIPGLTPRQVQVWFQNRRAKLKRLTSNDRERMLKSRALPDDFDTTQVLRTPFGNKASSEAPVLLTDGLQRLHDDEYVISPLSSASTTGNGFPSAASESYTHHGSISNRGAPLPISDLQRTRGGFPFPRSSSFSEASFNNPGLQFPGRFSRPGAEALGHPGIPYPRRPMDYALNRPTNGMMAGYNQHRPIEGSVSPTGQPEQQVPYNVDGANQQVHSYQSPLTMPAPKGYGGMDMNSHMPPHGRNMPTLQQVPVSDASDYRSYSYDHHPYGMSTGLPYTQTNASSLSLPASFPSDTGHVSQGPVGSSPEDRMNNPPHVLDPLRAKFGNQTFEYANYL